MDKINILDNLGIPYIIKKGKYKRITIGYYHGSTLIIKTPINMPFVKLEKFIVDNINWIISKQPKGYFSKVEYSTGNKYLFLGKEYELAVYQSKHAQIEHLKDKMIIYTSNLESAKIKEMVAKWRFKQAELILQEVLNKCFKEMEHYLNKYPHLEIKSYKSRWGCCYPKKNKIIINVSVVNLPLELIEYVIYHELSHFIHLNHSREFHEFLRKFVPNENKLRKEISKYNPIYE
jgi:predicted metal-dependent hydrolase